MDIVKRKLMFFLLLGAKGLNTWVVIPDCATHLFTHAMTIQDLAVQ